MRKMMLAARGLGSIEACRRASPAPGRRSFRHERNSKEPQRSLSKIVTIEARQGWVGVGGGIRFVP